MKYTKLILTVLTPILIMLVTSLAIKVYIDKLPKAEVSVAQAVPVDPTLVTRDFAEKVMVRCKAKLSDTKRSILTDQLVRVTHQRFDKEENRQAFMALLCIESGFNQAARSPVGATGIAQLMPKYAADFAKLCGYQTLDDGDILDTEVNLQLGSCFFAHLIKETGNVYISMAAFNGGLSGATTKALKQLKAGGPIETVNYVNRITVLKEDVRNEKPNYVTSAASRK